VARVHLTVGCAGLHSSRDRSGSRHDPPGGKKAGREGERRVGPSFAGGTLRPEGNGAIPQSSGSDAARRAAGMPHDPSELFAEIRQALTTR
jgi:hypothetical protein